jgi:hypothetical protein
MVWVRALATTVHDPESRLVRLLGRHTEALIAAHVVATAAVTSQTSETTQAALRASNISLTVEDGRGIGQARRTAVRAAADSGATSILYCDLDRWLHWRESFPDELGGLFDRIDASRPTPLYACLGRTTRAFGTHPKVQTVCEDATNRAVSAALRRRCDVTAGAAWLSSEGARLILSKSVEPTNATDAEWPTIVWRAASRRVLQARCEGLEFETATFHPAEVDAAGGRDAWIRQTYDTANAWATRLELASASVAAVVRVLGLNDPK